MLIVLANDWYVAAALVGERTPPQVLGNMVGKHLPEVGVRQQLHQQSRGTVGRDLAGTVGDRVGRVEAGDVDVGLAVPAERPFRRPSPGRRSPCRAVEGGVVVTVPVLLPAK